MKDGSALPDWIKVNPKSGVVVTEIPSNIDLLEFKVIGIDDKNNEFEIAVVIEAGELRQNRELAKEFAGEIDEKTYLLMKMETLKFNLMKNKQIMKQKINL